MNTIKFIFGYSLLMRTSALYTLQHYGAIFRTNISQKVDSETHLLHDNIRLNVSRQGN